VAGFVRRVLTVEIAPVTGNRPDVRLTPHEKLRRCRS
jgi:hypothetical protein